ncbi:hypothetical protein ACQR16_19085 [Bradyrhizobium oligotrophicum]|uniref:hypothetical protein n=1 Tax=Bradyrhizobium oligotrophicum TaxID=44255 RepID=UPI003EBDB354
MAAPRCTAAALAESASRKRPYSVAYIAPHVCQALVVRETTACGNFPEKSLRGDGERRTRHPAQDCIAIDQELWFEKKDFVIPVNWPRCFSMHPPEGHLSGERIERRAA